jgi:hypothetical protein
VPPDPLDALPEKCRLDLSDTEAALLCLSCGGRYAREVGSCVTCGGTTLASRARLLAAVRESAPDFPEQALARLRMVRVFDLDDTAAIDAMRRSLCAAGTPHLAVTRQGDLLGPGPTSGRAALFVSEDDEPGLRERAISWLPAGVDALEEEADPDVPLSALTEPMLLAVTHAPLETQWVRDELAHAGIAFASAPGASGQEFFVGAADLERANEVLDGLESYIAAQAPPAEEELERMALEAQPRAFAEAAQERATPRALGGAPNDPQSAGSGVARTGRRLLLGAIAAGSAIYAATAAAAGLPTALAWLCAVVAALLLVLDFANPGPG